MAIKSLEALAHGKPIVSTSLGLRGIEHPDVFHLIGDTPEKFAELLLTLCESPQKANRHKNYSRRINESLIKANSRERFLSILNNTK
jgi:glycosyltransferase involved in cell wall biosynthesis